MADVIDAHAHFVPRNLHAAVCADPVLRDVIGTSVLADGREALAMPGLDQVRAMPPALDSVQDSLRWLDERGIDRQIVGPWADLFGYSLAPEEGERWCRIVNDLQLAELDGQPRLLPLAILPLQDPARAIAEVQRVDGRGFVGVTIGCSAGKLELDDPALEPVWAELAERRLPVVMHPSFHAHETRTRDLGMPNAVGRPHDTDVAVARLVLSGTLARNPQTKLLLMHGGGSIPLLWGRLERNHVVTAGTSDPEFARECLWVDSVVYRPESLEFLVATMGPTRVLLGSDYPFPIQDPYPRQIIERSALSDDVRSGVLGRNAQMLFNL